MNRVVLRKDWPSRLLIVETMLLRDVIVYKEDCFEFWYFVYGKIEVFRRNGFRSRLFTFRFIFTKIII